MKQCKILKSFPYSKDGIRVEQADAGSEILLPARLVQGLIEAGYVSVTTVDAPVVTIDAPETKIIESAPEVKPAWLK